MPSIMLKQLFALRPTAKIAVIIMCAQNTSNTKMVIEASRAMIKVEKRCARKRRIKAGGY